MKTFHCTHCENLVFFENSFCNQCNMRLAYLPDRGELGALEPAGGEVWSGPGGARYRLCGNYLRYNICNWALPEGEAAPGDLCLACRLTQVIPDLSQPGNQERWYKLEVAKRRLLYTLNQLGLAVAPKADEPEWGLAFEFLADPAPAATVLTGHHDGVITINLAEADDPERERRRVAMHEPYRTLLGHFRHEVGHYYWDRLIRDGGRLDEFRRSFGDEREDYQAALENHYRQGPPADWPERFVSAYASSHAWEDWAESWAHYLHILDTLETAAACGLWLRPADPTEPRVAATRLIVEPGQFDQMLAAWGPVSYVLNSLNRGLGLPDAYPFTLPEAAREKLRFIDETVLAARGAGLLTSVG